MPVASSMMPPVERSCYWLAKRPARPVSALAGRAEADVAIVGAGLTGLWTAIGIKELDPAADVVVLEQAEAAYGASGRNAGMLSETVDHSHALAIEHFGETEARRLARLGERNVSEMVDFLGRHGITCDYEPVGRLMVALTPAQLEDARRAVETARRLGVETFTLLDRDELAARIRSPLYLGGVAVSGGGILDPVKLVDGLADHARRSGVRIHERSAVTRVERAGAGVRLGTVGGEVRAARAVLATSAYSHHLLPRLTRRFIPLYDYVLVS
ncbi:MAG TPA: FAD-dependent oxidoreductase, partial [Gemmatimonadales bacterium]|nr:FAD-dependent oxidoreductase [Gemmatimonadales bacterium]